ncbi:MAG: DUF2189 domain-containing protein [Stappiaceae bacterium]
MSHSEETTTPPSRLIHVRTVSFSDVSEALAAGWKDFTRRPLMSAFFGCVFAFSGLFILIALTYYGEAWMIIPVAIGFPLVGPFVAASLYEMSRRLQKGEDFGWLDIFGVVFKRRELSWMAFVVLFVFWMWIYQVRILLAIFLGSRSMASLDRFGEVIMTTSDGWLFLAVGTCVGAILSTILFSLTVISMPLLLDRDVDFITAMVFSVKTVLTSPAVMLSWGALVAAMAIFAMVPAFLGLIVVLPVLGHATWHLYERAIEIQPEDGAAG